MKRNRTTFKRVVTFLMFAIVIINSCKKDENNAVIPTLTTTAISNLTQSSATAGGNITDDGGAAVTSRGVCWSTSENPTIAGNKTNDGSGTGSFTSSITGLNANTGYFMRAYATNSAGTAYGSQNEFTTSQLASLPTVTTNEASNISTSSATVGGVVLSNGNAEITERGVFYATSPNPELVGTKLQLGTGIGSFFTSLNGLISNTTYYIKAYATNIAGTNFGNQVTFQTGQDVALAFVATNSVISFGSTSATLGGNITYDGNGTITDRGVYWGTSSNPESTGTKFQIGSGSGSFSALATGLTPNTFYYVKAYATNNAGTAYGSPVTFTTRSVPVVSTASVSIFSTSTATVGGNIDYDGNSSITERGIYWGTSSNPESTGFKFAIGSGSGLFSANLTGLEPNTTYYIRSYAVNSEGTGYGNEIFFTTLQVINIPAVFTADVTDFTGTTATVGGVVTDDGNGTISDRGVYYGTSHNPESTGTKHSIGSGIGTFSEDITGLSMNTTYYVKTFATNSAGTGFGDEVSFTTPGLPSVTTTAVTDFTSTGATVGGNVSSDGNSEVTESGVYWGTSGNPESTGTKLSISTGTGIFSADLSGLESNTTYYVKAYAVNAAGTVYGSQVNFTTTGEPVVSTSSVTIFTSTTGTVGGNVTADGNDPVIDRGVYWGISPDPELTGTKLSIGSGKGVFSNVLDGLTIGIKYYVKAFATNGVGTVFGEEVSFTTALTIGENFMGGVLAYILQPGDPGYIPGETHGLITTAADQAAGGWGANVSTGATATALGTGLTNTNTIVATPGVGGGAVKFCYDLVYGGYDDWYLPSIDELDKLYQNQEAIGGFPYNTIYWSSSEYLYNTAWRMNFTSGAKDYVYGYKSNSHSIRPVRSF